MGGGGDMLRARRATEARVKAFRERRQKNKQDFVQHAAKVHGLSAQRAEKEYRNVMSSNPGKYDTTTQAQARPSMKSVVGRRYDPETNTALNNTVKYSTSAGFIGSLMRGGPMADHLRGGSEGPTMQTILFDANTALDRRMHRNRAGAYRPRQGSLGTGGSLTRRRT